MRKLLSPVINLVSLVLVGIAYGLAGISAANNVAKTSVGNYYQLVWDNPSGLTVAGFFIIILATVVLLITFLPKGRKCTSLFAAILLIVGGVFVLLTPNEVAKLGSLPLTIQPALIGMATLLFVAAAFELIIACLEFTAKK